MFSSVLIPTDLSPASDRVIACAARDLASLGTRSMVLLHALGIRHLVSMAPALAASVEQRLAEQASELEKSGLSVEVAIAPGVAHEEILRVARERRSSLVILGSQGQSLLSEMRLGAVTLATLHNCDVPVLLARVACAESGGGAITCRALGTRVLHPTDFSDSSERAFAFVRALVEHGIGDVSLLHVQDRNDRSRVEGRDERQLAAFDETDRARLERLALDLKQVRAANVRIEVAHGSPIREILRRAAAAPEALVVMGTQGRGFIPEVFLGSVSHAVARMAKVPVLLVPGRSPVRPVSS